MSELSRIARAREHVDPHWGPNKVASELEALERTIARKKRRGALWGLAFAASSAGIIALTLLQPAAHPTVATRALPETKSEPALVKTPQETPAQAKDALATREALPTAEPTDLAAPTQEPTQAEPAAQEDARAQPRTKNVRVVAAGQEWRSLARAGRYREAYTAISEAHLDRKQASVDDLLLAADSARLSGHPSEAVPLYREAFEHHAKDPRAYLAAFTLGRTLLLELADPRRAAGAFERAHALAPKGPLAEEALARAVESWAKAGDSAHARSTAERYLRAFPNGRLRDEVKRHSGLD